MFRLLDENGYASVHTRTIQHDKFLMNLSFDLQNGSDQRYQEKYSDDYFPGRLCGRMLPGIESVTGVPSLKKTMDHDIEN